MHPPTHHRAVALVLAVLLALGLARASHPSPAPPPPAHAVRRASLEPVDPNTAPLDALERLPGVGPTLARRIVAARESGTRFERAEDLARVRGLGPSHLARLEPWLVFVTGRRPSEARPSP